MDVQEDTRELRPALDFGLEVEAHDGRALTLSRDEFPQQVGGAVAVGLSLDRHAHGPHLGRRVVLQEKVVRARQEGGERRAGKQVDRQDIDVGPDVLGVQRLLPCQIRLDGVAPDRQCALRDQRAGIGGAKRDGRVLQHVGEVAHPGCRPLSLPVGRVPDFVITNLSLEVERRSPQEFQPCLQDQRIGRRRQGARRVHDTVLTEQTERDDVVRLPVRADDPVDFAPVVRTWSGLEQRPGGADPDVERMVRGNGGIDQGIGKQELFPLASQVILMAEPEVRGRRPRGASNTCGRGQR